MYEYVITAGEGTLVKHGICEGSELGGFISCLRVVSDALAGKQVDFYFEAAGPDCHTGLLPSEVG